MKKGNLFSFLFISLIVILLGVLVVGFIIFFGKGIELYLSGIELSPLEDGVVISNTLECSDSDGGIFFGVNGTVSYEWRFIFLNLDREVSDECEGDVLMEFYCSSDGVVKGVVECENSCFDGACLEKLRVGG